MEPDWTVDLKKNACFRLDENLRMVQIALTKLRDYEPAVFESHFYKQPASSANSIGNLLLHLCGNMTQYILSSLCETPDNRDRDGEFDNKRTTASKEVIEQFEKTIEKVKKGIRTATAQQLLQMRSVQGFEMSGLGCVLHAVEHCSYHTGQIALWVKILTHQDLGFYDAIDLNQKNTPTS